VGFGAPTWGVRSGARGDSGPSGRCHSRCSSLARAARHCRPGDGGTCAACVMVAVAACPARLGRLSLYDACTPAHSHRCRPPAWRWFSAGVDVAGGRRGAHAGWVCTSILRRFHTASPAFRQPPAVLWCMLPQWACGFEGAAGPAWGASRLCKQLLVWGSYGRWRQWHERVQQTNSRKCDRPLWQSFQTLRSASIGNESPFATRGVHPPPRHTPPPPPLFCSLAPVPAAPVEEVVTSVGALLRKGGELFEIAGRAEAALSASATTA